MRKASAVMVGLALLVAGAAALARQGERETEAGETATVKVRKISAIVGSEVRVSEEALGKVTDVVISEGGCIDYLIVADGEEEFVAVPWGAVRYEAGARAITVTARVTREKLRAVRFRASAWPDFASDRWTRSASEVWGERSLRRPRDTRGDTREGDVRPGDKRLEDKGTGGKRPSDKRLDDKGTGDERLDDKGAGDKRPRDKRLDDKGTGDKRKGDVRPDGGRKKETPRDTDKERDGRSDDKRPPVKSPTDSDRP